MIDGMDETTKEKIFVTGVCFNDVADREYARVMLVYIKLLGVDKVYKRFRRDDYTDEKNWSKTRNPMTAFENMVNAFKKDPDVYGLHLMYRIQL